MKGILRLAAFIIILCPAVVMAQPSRQTSAAISPTVEASKQDSIASQTTITEQDSELLLIKEQNRLIKEFQSSQQATVYWALGGILSFVVILTGLSILTNFKLYDQDKERLRFEFEGKISAYRAEFNLQVEEYKRESDKSSEQKNQILQDRFLTQLSEARKSIEDVRSELISDLKSTNDNIKDFDKNLSETKNDLSEIESILRDVEVLVWDLRNIPGNMLITHSQGLTAAVNSGYKSRVTHVLKQVVNTLENKYCQTGESIEPVPYEYLDKSLHAANKLDPAGVSKVREKLAELVIDPAPAAS